MRGGALELLVVDGGRSTPGLPQTPARALVVDDDPADRRVIARTLRGCGIDALEAADGVSGLRMLVDHLLDLRLLVTDLEMPGLCGESLIRTVRFLGGERDLPILVVSGRLHSGRAERLRASGVSATVDKGEGPDAVAIAARRLLPRGVAGETKSAPTIGPLPLARIRLAPPPVRPS